MMKGEGGSEDATDLSTQFSHIRSWMGGYYCPMEGWGRDDIKGPGEGCIIGPGGWAHLLSGPDDASIRHWWGGGGVGRINHQHGGGSQ